MVTNRIKVSISYLLADLGFDNAEAQVLALRADLMAKTEKFSLDMLVRFAAKGRNPSGSLIEHPRLA